MQQGTHGEAGAAGGRILLIEDDDGLRALVAKVLRSGGYLVDEAASEEEAVAAFDRACPDLLLSDLVLPGSNGQQLAARCRARCPDTMLAFMSGYSADELHDLDIRQVVFIPKPIPPSELLALVDGLMAQRAGPAVGTGESGVAIPPESP
jgi:two-component system, cell cycle sensor histidine kinase and response regulator CckA